MLSRPSTLSRPGLLNRLSNRHNKPSSCSRPSRPSRHKLSSRNRHSTLHSCSTKRRISSIGSRLRTRISCSRHSTPSSSNSRCIIGKHKTVNKVVTGLLRICHPLRLHQLRPIRGLWTDCHSGRWTCTFTGRTAWAPSTHLNRGRAPSLRVVSRARPSSGKAHSAGQRRVRSRVDLSWTIPEEHRSQRGQLRPPQVACHSSGGIHS
mmetsp:Transcript_48956/g.140225  ORF Transcript_48956/g.140225 Transcript_48956/m.140225 type:complete len:206 (-) Transcript_48956:246-863(-)